MEIPANFGFDETVHRGASHLAISAPAASFQDARFNTPGTTIKVDVSTDDGKSFTAIGYPNNDGYLSDLRISLEATSFHEAMVNSRLLIVPLLGSLAASHDIPLVISHISMREVSTGVYHRSIIAPFVPAAGSSLPAVQTPEARTLVNSYRDALNSSDPSWRFLCFARIVEQLWKWQGARQKAGEVLAFDLERIAIPEEPVALEAWVRQAFPSRYVFDPATYADIVPNEARGLTTNEIIVRFIRPIRADIAHGLFDRGLLPVTKNDIEHLERVRRWLPMLRCIARVHLSAVLGVP